MDINKMIKKHRSCIVIFSISAIVTSLILLFILYKPPLCQASIDDLKDIDGIGVYRAGAIVEYVTYHPDSKIDDLDDIEGIGEITVQKIKEKYR